MIRNISIDKAKSFEFLLLESSVLFTVARVISIAFSFLAFSLLARKVSPEIFGEIDVLLSGIIFLVNLSIFGQDQALGRLINDPIDIKDKRNISIHGFIIQVISSILIIGFIYIFSQYLYSFEIFNYINNGNKIIYVILAQIPFQVITIASLGLLQWSIHRRAYILISILSGLIPAITLIFSIEYTKPTILIVLTSYLISRLLVSIISISILLRREIIKWPKLLDLNLIKRLYIFALPLGLVVGLETISPLLERLLIRSYLNEFDLGQFALAARICSIITIFGAAFATGFGPYSLRFYNEPKAKYSFELIFKSIILSSCFSILIFTIFSKDIVFLFGGNNFISSSKLLLPLSIGCCIDICDNVTGIGLFIKKQNLYFLFSYLLFIIAFTTIFILLHPYLGLISIGWSIATAQLIKALFNTFFSNRFYKVNWPYKANLLEISITILISIYFSVNDFPGYFLFKIIILLISILVLTFLFLKSLNKFELITISRLSRRIKSVLKT